MINIKNIDEELKDERVRTYVAAIACGIIFGLAGIVLMANEKKIKAPDYEEGFKAGVLAAQAVAEQEREQKAMMWWSGANDLAGARERLCWNYYPRKEKR